MDVGPRPRAAAVASRPPVVRRGRRVRRASPRSRVPARPPRRRRPVPRRPAGRDHLRPPPRRDHHRVRAAAPVRPRRAPRSASRRPASTRRSSSTSTSGCARRRTTRSSRMIAGRGPFRVPDDTGRGVRLPAGRDPGDAGARARAGFEVVVVPPFELDGHPVRSTEVRAAIAAGDLALAARSSAVRTRWSARRWPSAGRGACRAFRCLSPCRPTGRTASEDGPSTPVHPRSIG